jgi:hypothetical protein
MVRATRVANPLSRALGAGIGIGAMAAAFFLMTNHDGAKPVVGSPTAPSIEKMVAAS